MQALAPVFVAKAVWIWIALGALGLAYMVICPAAYHHRYTDYAAGVLVGIGLVACFVRTPTESLQ